MAKQPAKSDNQGQAAQGPVDDAGARAAADNTSSGTVPPRPPEQRPGGDFVRSTRGEAQPVDPIPPRSEEPLSGFPPQERGYATKADRENVLNPDKGNPTAFDRSKMPATPLNDPFLPNQAVIGETMGHPGRIAIQPYGPEPQNIEPGTGKVLPTPVKDPEAVESAKSES